MDEQNQLPNTNSQSVNPQPAAPPATTPSGPASPVAQVAKPELNVSDKEAQALLAINNIGAGQHTKHKLPLGMIITILVLLVLVAFASHMIGDLQSKKTVNTANGMSTGSPSQTNSSTGQGVDKQVNQDVNNCSNVVNALSEC